MLSRRHVRIKVLQALYTRGDEGYTPQQGRETLQVLERNIGKLYELYLYMLTFLVELGEFSMVMDDEQKARRLKGLPETATSVRLYQNPILQKLMHSELLAKACKEHKVMWAGDQDLLRKIFLDLKSQEVYVDYTQFASERPLLYQEILSYIIKQYSNNHALLIQHLEEEYFNWLDDKKIAQSMVLKTIVTMAEEEVDGLPAALQPLSHDKDNILEFAKELLQATLEQRETIDAALESRLSKWDPHQLAKIDLILIKMAVAEFLYFASIPPKVTINEYLELAKNYSTPQSKKFVNAVLDNTLKELQSQGKVAKS